MGREVGVRGVPGCSDATPLEDVRYVESPLTGFIALDVGTEISPSNLLRVDGPDLLDSVGACEPEGPAVGDEYRSPFGGSRPLRGD